MGCNHGDNTAGSQNEPPTSGLGDGICRFVPDLGPISKNDGLLANSPADDAPVYLQPLSQRWTCFAVVPVDDLKEVIRE